MPNLKPAADMVRENAASQPNETADYRTARNALLEKEIALRRLNEEVAQMRRALPPGGEVTGDYRFMGKDGPLSLADLFEGKDTLVVYGSMFGPSHEKPCPMCTNHVDSWDAVAANARQRTALAVVGRDPIEKLTAYAKERGWRWMPLVQDVTGAYGRDYHGLTDDGVDIPSINVFTRKDGVIRHFWGGEMGEATVDPGQDGRGAPDASSLWTILDMTPEGRGDFYPKLSDRDGMEAP